MEQATPATAKTAQRIPGVEGVWVFVGADMVFFAMLFVSFMVDRLKSPELYELSRLTLDPDFGGINTLILLASSWFVVVAVQAVREDRLAEVPRWLAAAFLCGFAFGISKAFEYGAKLQAGITPATNDFYMYYFVLTGFHLLHVTAGTVMLMLFWHRARKREFTKDRMVVLECGGIYWHMVDLLWIVLFPLLYLMRSVT